MTENSTRSHDQQAMAEHLRRQAHAGPSDGSLPNGWTQNEFNDVDANGAVITAGRYDVEAEGAFRFRPLGAGIYSGNADPAETEFQAPRGSLYLCTTDGSVWSKTGSSPNQWQALTLAQPEITAFEKLTANVIVPPADFAYLSWSHVVQAGNAVLLDLSDPTTPTVITSGIYTVSGFSSPDGYLPLGAQYEITLLVGGLGISETSAPATEFFRIPYMNLSMTRYLEAGTSIRVSALTGDPGLSPQNFKFDARVQKVT